MRTNARSRRSVLQCPANEVGAVRDSSRVSLGVALVQSEARRLLAARDARHVANERERCPFSLIPMNEPASFEAAQIEHHAFLYLQSADPLLGAGHRAVAGP